MKIKRWIGVLLCMLLCICLMPTMAFAADRDAVLTVNGVDALTTSSGEGWSYDSRTNTLALDGYNGGSIIASYMDLTVALAEGSTNVVSTSDEYGIAYYQDSFTSPYYDLHIVGSKGSTLKITATNHAVFSKGNLFIENCNLTAKNTTTSNTTDKMECVSSESNISIKNSTLDVTTATGVGITSYNHTTITGSTIAVEAGMIGVHANNKNLVISSSDLEVTGGTAALYSYFGAVYLTECTGKLTGKTAAIYAHNLDNKSQTEIVNCDFEITGLYGVMTYSGILIENGDIKFDCTDKGIYSYSASYDAEAQMKGSATIECSSNTTQLMQVNGTYIADDSADVTGVILENTGDTSTTQILLVGDLIISSDTSFDKNVLIPAGSTVTVASGVSFDLSSAPSVTIEGTLKNEGTLAINGAAATNKGTIYNYSKINLADNKAILNSGKIYSVCTSDFDLTPYSENGVILHANLVHVNASATTHLTEGNIEYWHCGDCSKYFSDEAGTRETTLADTIIPKLTEHTADGTGWHTDADNHWNTCECGEITNKEAHTFKWVVDKEATKTEAGSKHEKCTVCGYEKAAVEIPATGTKPGPSQPTTPPVSGGDKTDDSKSPGTGDNSNLFLWVALLVLAGAGLVGTTLYRRKRKHSR